MCVACAVTLEFAWHVPQPRPATSLTSFTPKHSAIVTVRNMAVKVFANRPYQLPSLEGDTLQKPALCDEGSGEPILA